MIKIAINGYGRIGRNVLRALYEAKLNQEITLAAINATMDIEAVAHLTRYDTTHGRFNCEVEVDNDHIVVNGDRIRYTSDRNPANLPWGELGIDVVLECTGKFKSKSKAQAHIDAGAKKVLISAPGDADVDATIVYGVNDDILKADDTVVSCASCTTNCLVPIVKALNDAMGVEHGLVTTVHAYTNDQNLIDAPHKDLRRARSATMSMIPTSTGAAKAVGLVLPELAGKLHGYAIRVPTINVSLVDLTFTAKRDTDIAQVNEAIQNVVQTSMKGIIEYCDKPLVSCDFNHNPASAIYDATLTQVMEKKLVKISAWYDNEWGYSNRMLDTVLKMMQC